jgi:hypothetical protein
MEFPSKSCNWKSVWSVLFPRSVATILLLVTYSESYSTCIVRVGVGVMLKLLKKAKSTHWKELSVFTFRESEGEPSQVGR